MFCETNFSPFFYQPRLLRRLASLHSLTLFNARRFDLAIDAFIALNLSPSKVVSLFPEPISGKLFLDPAAREEVFGGRAQHKVRQAMEDALFTTTPEETAEEGKGKEPDNANAPNLTPATPTKKKEDEDSASPKTHSSLVTAAASKLKGSKNWLRDSSRAEQDAADAAEKAARQFPILFYSQNISAHSFFIAEDQQRHAKADALNFSRSVDVLIRYLTDRRQKYAQALSALSPAIRPSPTAQRPRASGAELLELPDLPLTELKPELLARVAQVVDTALFRSYLASKPVMVGPLCRIENWCEVEEVEELLLAAKVWFILPSKFSLSF